MYMITWFPGFSFEPVTPVMGVVSKCDGCKSASVSVWFTKYKYKGMNFAANVMGENSTAMGTENSTENLGLNCAMFDVLKMGPRGEGVGTKEKHGICLMVRRNNLKANRRTTLQYYYSKQTTEGQELG